MITTQCSYSIYLRLTVCVNTMATKKKEKKNESKNQKKETEVNKEVKKKKNNFIVSTII